MGSGILGTNVLAGHGFFGFDPTPNASLVNTVRNGVNVNGNGGFQPDTNAVVPQVKGVSTSQPNQTAPQVLGTTTSSGAAPTAPDNTAASNAYIDQQLGDLNSLLGRTQTGLDQGLSNLNSSYQGSVNQQQNQENQALQDYGDQRTATNKDKLTAYDTANKNANNGYRSLAQIIGRASGSGSSAFQDLLPEVVGRDLSSKRTDANQTYASNLGNIDTAQKKTELSFSNILQDLANQRLQQENTLRTGVEGQRQDLLAKEQQLNAQRGNLAGAQALQPQIDSSRNTVEGFFNQFQPTYTPQQAAIAAPDLSQYTVDRSNVNAQNQGAPDPTNPYADLLRKKLQEQPA